MPIKNIISNSAVLSALFLSLLLFIAVSAQSSDDVLTDPRDGKTYRTVRLGNHTWMAENINHEVADRSCIYNSPDSCDKYGGLYTWYDALSACSGLGEGWRLPSDDDWNTLYVPPADGHSGIGRRLKSTSGWLNDGNGSDEYGFSALPSVLRFVDIVGEDTIRIAGAQAEWWTSSTRRAYYCCDSYSALSRNVKYDSDYISHALSGKGNRYSVRCVRD